MIRFTYKCRVNGMQPETLLALFQLSAITEKTGTDVYITSVTNGQHMPGSLHYVGYAFDFDTAEGKEHQLQPISNQLSMVLPPEYDIVTHTDSSGLATHVHVEYQPKLPLNKEPAHGR